MGSIGVIFENEGQNTEDVYQLPTVESGYDKKKNMFPLSHIEELFHQL